MYNNVKKGFLQINPSQNFSNINLLAKIKNIVLLSKYFSVKKIYLKVISWLLQYFKKSEILTKKYAKAKIKQEQNIAKYIEAKTTLLKTKEAIDFNDIINEIFSDDGLPDIAKALKLSKIIENDPNILTQLNKTKDILFAVCNKQEKI